MKDYVATQWQDTLTENQLADFAKIWSLDAPWFEEPNYRRGGWSGVAKLTLSTATGDKTVFLKRQLNHIYKPLSHPIKGAPTFAREMKNILRFKHAQIPSLEPVYYAQRRDSEGLKAILITEALDGFQSLEACLHDCITAEDRQQYIQPVAELVKQLHTAQFRHGCLYPKHLFVKQHADTMQVRIIDLEKARFWPFRQNRQLRDLGTLYRHTQGITIKEKIKFLHYYLGTPKLGTQGKNLWQAFVKRYQRKHMSK